jgi:hypothetical protein
MSSIITERTMQAARTVDRAMDAFLGLSEAEGVFPKAKGEIALDTSSNHADDPGCLWCGAPMPVGRRRGSARRFCRTEHRMSFHSAARRFVNQAIAAGRLMVADLHAPGKACALATGVSRPWWLSHPPSGRMPLVRVLWAEPPIAWPMAAE